ncbi:uncharacterized protein LOC108885748 [Lates calcarifer]|uniref:Uncharacterized protein LOC108885748 n=1 Tax=Lates calcarifer TaxID=8187 RepID=A0A4W6EJJ1_LATCA|nr:uncharacterized protein LOC108885748 [Lates calcarifer]
MQRYWWPGYEMQLLAELQRQQNNAQFCDTLLQTEGISVPTHSCILAALSPYLSQKLSASPSPPSGQKHRLQLQPVKAQTLLKLVGLLYSGQLEVKGSVEHDDVLAVARQFGIADLVEGQKDEGMNVAELQEKRRSLGRFRENGRQAEESRWRDENRKMQDAQVQAEMVGRRDTDSPIEKRSCISIGTQTVKAGEKSVGSFIILSGQATPLSPESELKAQSLDFSVMLQPQSLTLDKQFCSTSCPGIYSMDKGAPSDGESPLNQSSGCVINPTSTPALFGETLTFPISLIDDSESPSREEGSGHQQSSESGDSLQALAEERTELENGKRNGMTADDRGDTEQPSQADIDEMPGEESTKSTVRHVGTKNMAKMKEMQQMMETTQISIRVKLRRRTKGEVWEVVSMRDADETLSVLASLRQDGCHHKRPETDLSDIPLPPSLVQPNPIQKPEWHILQPVTNSLTSPLHPNTSSDSQPPSSDCFTPNQNDGLKAAPVLQHQDSVEESDEQIERLLEDIMMGINILPNLERDFKKSHHLQLSHDGVLNISQDPVTQNDAGHNQMHAAVSAAGCVFNQDLGSQTCNSSADTGIHCCFTVQNQSSCSSLSSVLPDAAVIQQRQECSPHYYSSVRSMWQSDEMSHQNMPLSKSQECPHLDAPTTRSVIPSAFFSSGQKLHYPALWDLSSQDSQHNLEFLPLKNGNETQSMHTTVLSIPCMDDLRLPQCLSPLEPCTSATKHQPVPNNPVNLGNKVQQQPSLHGRPWLTENPGSLKFPLSAITCKENKSMSLPQDTNYNCLSKHRQEHLELNRQNEGILAESCTVKEVEERETLSSVQPNAAELKSDPRKMKEDNTAGNTMAPKRRTKRTSHPQDAASSLLAYKHVKIGDGTKSQINLSVCQVSLSSNNVLAKERGMATSSMNILSKPNQQSLVTESLREKPRISVANTAQTRIRTRGFLKKTEKSPSDTSPEDSLVAKPGAYRAQTANKQGVTNQKRGRPPKTKLKDPIPPNNNPALPEKMGSNEESQQKMDRNLPKEDLEKGDKTKQKCKKRRLNRSTEEGVIPPKKTISIESTDKPDAGINDIIPDVRKLGASKWPQMVTLKEFQKLIKRQHSKTRKLKESQETNGTVKDAESEGMVNRDSTYKESAKDKEMDIDITQPQDRVGSEQSPVISVTVDKNHNQVFSESTDGTDSSTKKTSFLCGGNQPVFSFDDLEEVVAKLAAEREQPLMNLYEGTACDVINNEGLSHSDTHLPQLNKPWHHNLYTRTPERTGPPLPGAGGIVSGCDQEEEEEVEVDVLLYSPVKVPQTGEREDGLINTEITLDEDEEEDVNEIDVTG